VVCVQIQKGSNNETRPMYAEIRPGLIGPPLFVLDTFVELGKMGVGE
jgi:hypothetical protein